MSSSDLCPVYLVRPYIEHECHIEKIFHIEKLFLSELNENELRAECQKINELLICANRSHQCEFRKVGKNAIVHQLCKWS